jgi:hypothetical protein
MAENAVPDPISDDDAMTAAIHLASAGVHLRAAARALEDVAEMYDTTAASEGIRSVLERLNMTPTADHEGDGDK